jgi:cytochrome c oxidase assembly protein subunit 15
MHRSVRAWVVSLCALIVLMVAVGGITRLTGSGLSIVDWKPLMGAIPPLNDAEWNDVYTRYQNSPQGQTLNAGMSLEQFKDIFFWEYIHRLLGRLIGAAFFFPWLFFLVCGKLKGALAKRLLVAFFLGGLQGALGWYMVKSGLVNQPYVSHIRLAAHLTLALLVLCYLYWVLLVESGAQTRAKVSRAIKFAVTGALALLSLQIVYGAFVAGTKAGYAYPTFPKMHDHWLPPEAFQYGSIALDLIESSAMVQFVHRTLGWTLLLSLIGLRFWVGREKPSLKSSMNWVLGLVVAQFCLGIATVLFHVPITIAVAHQICACFLLLSLVRVNYLARFSS